MLSLSLRKLIYPAILAIALSCEESSINEIEPESELPPEDDPPPEVVIDKGAISGKVVDVSTGLGLPGAAVFVVGSRATTEVVSAANGDYELVEIPVGAATVRAEKNTYFADQKATTIVKDQTTTNINLGLLPESAANGNFTIVLTWGESPTDLDSYLYIPNGDPFYELNYIEMGDTDGTLDANPFAALDVDAVEGFGPETISIKQSSGSAHYNGTYRFFVHNFSGQAPLTASTAVVKVYSNGALVKTYNVPTSGSGGWWHVFDLNGNTITDVNTLVNAKPGPP